MTNDRELLNAAYAHFNARELEDTLALMQPDVLWPNGMEGGWVHGHQGVRDYWTRQWAILDPHVDPVGFQAEPDGRIAVSVHQVVHDKTGALLMDLMIEHVYRIDNGLIQSMEIRDKQQTTE
ncbi:nuclear transport factor 2 family protein [Acidicapsa dinghuensis]|uniref:Nuclear transport factor 2 family protein n=1 Tax=Acidicapsa dinghuensis TaxID=2218256 RepID=A0ABW1ERA2_9BACT|nr:nuclear transport factor 2 family protein [Acidicapsa dinghuensis]